MRNEENELTVYPLIISYRLWQIEWSCDVIGHDPNTLKG